MIGVRSNRAVMGGVLMACALLASAFSPAPPAAAAPLRAKEDGSVVVTLQPYVGRLVTLLATLGQDRLILLLDTGGGQTIISPRVAARVGCKPGGRRVAFRMTGERVVFEQCDAAVIEVGGRRTSQSGVAVWDLASVLPRGIPPVDGVLALDALADQPFTLNLAARTLILESSSSLKRRVATMTRVNARTAPGYLART